MPASRAVGTAHPLASAADLVAEAEMHERLVRSVLGLPEPYRTVVLRRYFQQLSPREIASLTGTPAGTVRAQLSRALALLRSSVRGNDADAWPAPLVALAASGSGQGWRRGGRGSRPHDADQDDGAGWARDRGRDRDRDLGGDPRRRRAGAFGCDRGRPGSRFRSPRTEAAKDAVAPAPVIHPRAVESRDEPGAPSLTVNVKWAEDGTPAEGVAVLARRVRNAHGHLEGALVGRRS